MKYAYPPASRVSSAWEDEGERIAAFLLAKMGIDAGIAGLLAKNAKVSEENGAAAIAFAKPKGMTGAAFFGLWNEAKNFQNDKSKPATNGFAVEVGYISDENNSFSVKFLTAGGKPLPLAELGKIVPGGEEKKDAPKMQKNEKAETEAHPKGKASEFKPYAAVEYARKLYGDEVADSLNANIVPLLNKPDVKWSGEAKLEFLHMLIAMAYFLPEDRRTEFFKPNLKDGDHSLVSTLSTWDQDSALHYGGMLFKALSGSVSERAEDLRNDIRNGNTLASLANALNRTPLLEDDQQTVPPLRSSTVDQNGAFEFLTYAAPSLAYNDQNLFYLRDMLDELVRMDDRIVLQTGAGKTAKERTEAGIIGVKKFYGMVVPSFAYSEPMLGLLHRTISDQLTAYLSSLSGNIANGITRQGLQNYLNNKGLFVPVGRGEVQDTEDGYLLLDMRRAVNITYVYQLTPLVPDYPVMPSADVVTGWRYFTVPNYGGTGPIADPEKLVRFQSLNLKVGQNGAVGIVDGNGQPIYGGIIREARAMRLDEGILPPQVILLGKDSNVEIDKKTGKVSGNVEKEKIQGASPEALWFVRAFSGLGNFHRETTNTPTDLFDRYSGNLNANVDISKPEAGGAPTYGDERITGQLQGNLNVIHDKSKVDGTESLTGSGLIYTRGTAYNKFESIYNTLWGLYQLGQQDYSDAASTNTSTGEVESIQLGMDSLTRYNRRYGAFFADLTGSGSVKSGSSTVSTGAHYQRADALLNPRQYPDSRSPYMMDQYKLFQAGLGGSWLSRTVPTKPDVNDNRLRAALDIAQDKWRFTAGGYSLDQLRLRGFANPAYTDRLNPFGHLDYFDYRNWFSMANFAMGTGWTGVASLSRVTSGGLWGFRDEWQPRVSVFAPNWDATLVGVKHRDSEKWGELGKFRGTWGGTSLAAQEVYDPGKFGSGVNVRLDFPVDSLQQQLWLAAYHSSLEYAGFNYDSSTAAYYNSPVKVPDKVDVFKGYVSLRPSTSVRIEASGTKHPRTNQGAMRFVFNGNKYFGAFLQEDIAAYTSGSTTTEYVGRRYGAGAGGGYRIAPGVWLSGAGFSTYENTIETTEQIAGVSVATQNQTPYRVSRVSGEAVFDDRLAIRMGFNIYPYTDRFIPEIGAYYQVTPTSQLQATKTSNLFEDRYGTAFASLGYGGLNGLSGSVSYTFGGRYGANYEIGKYEAKWNFIRDVYAYGLHHRIWFPGVWQYRTGLGAGMALPVERGTFFGVFGFEYWREYNRNLARTTNRVDINTAVTFQYRF